MKIATMSVDLRPGARSSIQDADWTRRRPCGDCGSLDLSAATPVLPHTLEAAVYLLDDAILQGAYRALQTFVCRSCGCRWRFDQTASVWSKLA